MKQLTLSEYIKLKNPQQTPAPLPPSKTFWRGYQTAPEITFAVIHCAGVKATVYYYTELIVSFSQTGNTARFINHFQILYPGNYYKSGVYEGIEPFLNWLYESVQCVLAVDYAPGIKTKWQESIIFNR